MISAMRRLVVALLALALSGTMLTLAAPADASGYTWHTMMKNRRAVFQACKQPTGYDAYHQRTDYMVNWRVNNRRGHKYAWLSITDTDGTQWLHTGSIPWVAPHRKKGPIGYSPEYDSTFVSVSTRYGHHRKTGEVTVAMIGLC
jgi:hypothetical protein